MIIAKDNEIHFKGKNITRKKEGSNLFPLSEQRIWSVTT